MKKAILLSFIYLLLLSIEGGFTEKRSELPKTLFSLRNERESSLIFKDREVRDSFLEEEANNRVEEVERVSRDKEVKESLSGEERREKVLPLPQREIFSLKDGVDDIAYLKREISALAREDIRLKRMLKEMEERLESVSRLTLEEETSEGELTIREETHTKREEVDPAKEYGQGLPLPSSTKVPITHREGKNFNIFGVVSLVLNALFFLGFLFSLNLYLKRRKESQDEKEPLIYSSIIRTGVNELKDTYNRLRDELEERIKEEILDIDKRRSRLEEMIKEIEERVKVWEPPIESTPSLPKSKPHLIDVSKEYKPKDAIYSQIYRLSKEGLSIDEISKRTQMDKGRISLILRLNRGIHR